MTAEQVRTRGLAALRRELGNAGLIRFLQHFGAGIGDYTEDRKRANRDLTMTAIRAAAKKRSSKR